MDIISIKYGITTEYKQKSLLIELEETISNSSLMVSHTHFLLTSCFSVSRLKSVYQSVRFLLFFLFFMFFKLTKIPSFIFFVFNFQLKFPTRKPVCCIGIKKKENSLCYMSAAENLLILIGFIMNGLNLN